MRRLTISAIAGLAALAAGAAKPAQADQFVFGGGADDGKETLTLGLSLGGTVVLNTETNEINPGVANQGWWSPTDGTINTNTNYITGNFVVGSTSFYFNDFFTFSLAGLSTTDSVVSVTLGLNSYSQNGSGTLPFDVGSVSIDPDVLNAKINNPSATIYDALALGNYGSFGVDSTDVDTLLSFALNANAVNDINTAIGAGDPYFSVGGTDNVQEKVTPVPEPASLALFGTALAGLGLLRRRKRAA